MKKTVYFLVFDGFADWEASYALAEINKSGKFEVVTVGFSLQTIATMGGLKIVPDISIDDVGFENIALFIFPGGDMWEEKPQEKAINLLRKLKIKNVPVAAICGATLEIARAGLTEEMRHTSNARDYLKAMVSDYRDEDFYVEDLAVSDKNLITASGAGAVEFAREIIKFLNIYGEADAEKWFMLFKHGVWAGD